MALTTTTTTTSMAATSILRMDESFSFLELRPLRPMANGDVFTKNAIIVFIMLIIILYFHPVQEVAAAALVYPRAEDEMSSV